MQLTGSRLRDLRAQAHHLKPVLQAGKQGASDAFVAEVAAALKREHLIKVRLRDAVLESGGPKDVAQDLAARTKAVLVEVKGHTVVLYRPTKGERAA
jgi:RNA-binding protein